MSKDKDDWYPAGVCPRCNRMHPRCKGHNHAGMPCMAPPMREQDVCRVHGGSSPQAKARAEAIAVRRRAAAMLTGYGIELHNVDPLTALSNEVSRAAAAVQFYGMLVAELRIPDAQQPMSELGDVVGVDDDGNPVLASNMAAVYGRDHKGDGAPHVLVRLWNEERDRLARMCKMALDAGIDQRMIDLAESEARVVVEVIVAVIDAPELGLDPAMREVGRRVAAERLRALQAG